MTRTKWFASFLGLLLVGGAFFFFRSPAATKPGPVADATVAAPPASADAKVFRAGVPKKRIMDLYETESVRVGKTDPDPAATQKRLEVVAGELSAEEVQWLERQALDPKSDTDARFFAVYMMGLSPQSAAIA